MLRRFVGGEGGIRTPDTVARMPHFECGAFNHSATSPLVDKITGPGKIVGCAELSPAPVRAFVVQVPIYGGMISPSTSPGPTSLETFRGGGFPNYGTAAQGGR